jgi:type IV secretion system protein VirB2
MTITMKKTTAERILLGGLILAAVLSQVDAAAAQTASFQPLNTMVTSVLTFMTGTFATTCATIAVAAVGFMAFTSRIPWGWAFSVMVGISLIFGASQIVSSLNSGAAN